MKKIILIMLTFGFAVLTACGTNNIIDNEDQSANGDKNTNYFEGYVADFKDNRVLVTEQKLKEPFSEMDIENAYDEAGNAIYFKLDDIASSYVDSLMFGEKVKVIHGEIAESYPGQGTAQEIIRLVDEQHDLIVSSVEDSKNIVNLNQFLDGKALRKVSYTVEGDPVFTNIFKNNKSIDVFVDATQDSYGKANGIRAFQCTHVEEVYEEGQINVSLKECNNEGNELLVLEAPINQIIVPEQEYLEVNITVNNNEVVYKTNDANHIQDIIDQITSGEKTSVMVMSLMKPDGIITLKGEELDLTYDYYKTGGVIAHNVFIETELNFD